MVTQLDGMSCYDYTVIGIICKSCVCFLRILYVFILYFYIFREKRRIISYKCPSNGFLDPLSSMCVSHLIECSAYHSFTIRLFYFYRRHSDNSWLTSTIDPFRLVSLLAVPPDATIFYHAKRFPVPQRVYLQAFRSLLAPQSSIEYVSSRGRREGISWTQIRRRATLSLHNRASEWSQTFSLIAREPSQGHGKHFRPDARV